MQGKSSPLRLAVPLLFIALLLFPAAASYAFSDGQNAALEIGQPAGVTEFTTSAHATTQSGLHNPKSLTFDSAGNLWVVDISNERILEYTMPFTDGEAASLEIGQPAGVNQFTTSGCALTQSGLCNPKDVAFDPSGNLWVDDSGHGRILEYTAPFSDGEAASLEIGQPAGVNQFTTSGCALTQSGVCDVDGIAFDRSGDLWIADHSYNRLLEFTPPFSDGMNAALEIGQPAGANQFTTSAQATTQSGLRGPSGLTFDSSGDLWVADNFNNRVVEFTPPFSDGMNAALEIGQPAGATQFTTNLAATTQSGLSLPHDTAFDGSGNLWVSDSSNFRVLEYTAPFSDGEAASMEIGQPAGANQFTTNVAATSQSGLEYPEHIAFDSSGNLWVTDIGNNRVLEFLVPTVPPVGTGAPMAFQPTISFNSSCSSTCTASGSVSISGMVWLPAFAETSMPTYVSYTVWDYAGDASYGGNVTLSPVHEGTLCGNSACSSLIGIEYQTFSFTATPFSDLKGSSSPTIVTVTEHHQRISGDLYLSGSENILIWNR